MNYKLKIFAVFLVMVSLVGCTQKKEQSYTVQEILEPYIGDSFMFMEEKNPGEYGFGVSKTVIGFNFKSNQFLDYIDATVGYEASSNTYYNSDESKNNSTYLENVKWDELFVIPGTKLLIKSVEDKIDSSSIVYWFDKTDREVLRLNTLGELVVGSVDYSLSIEQMLKQIGDDIAPQIKESNNLKYSIELGKQGSEFSFDKTVDDTINALVKKSEYGIGDTFRYSGVNLTFTDISEWTTVEDEESDLYQKSVFLLPVKVENKAIESEGLSDSVYIVIGPNGEMIVDVNAYFEGSIDKLVEIPPSASVDSFIPILYDGDGEYKIYFHTLLDEQVLTFEVYK